VRPEVSAVRGVVGAYLRFFFIRVGRFDREQHAALDAVQHLAGRAAGLPLPVAGQKRFPPDRLFPVLHVKNEN